MMTQAEIDRKALSEEFESYVLEKRRVWLNENKYQTTEVYEVLNRTERAKVHKCFDQLNDYIAITAEAWWEKRGYGCIWPDDNSEPMGVYKLEGSTETEIEKN
jgi:hypothetical protein